MLIVLCFWHNNPETVSLSPDVCSDSFAIAATCLVLVEGHDSSDAESWKEEVGLGMERGDTRLSCAVGGMLGVLQTACPGVWELCSGCFYALFLFHWLLHVGCMCAET